MSLQIAKWIRESRSITEGSYEEKLEWLEQLKLAFGRPVESPYLDHSPLVSTLLEFFPIPDDSIRLGVLELLTHFHTGAVADKLLEYFNNFENPRVRCALLKLLFRDGGGETAARLADLYSRERDLQVRSQLIKGFGDFPSAGAEALIKKELTNRHYRIRANALEALEKIAPPDIGSLLVPLLEDQSPRVRVNATMALFSLEKQGDSFEKSMAILAGMASHAEPAFRASAAWAFGVRRLEVEIPGLLNLLSDDISSVRFQASEAFRRLGDTFAPALLTFAREAPRVARKEILRIFGDFGDTASFDYLAGKLGSADTWERFLAFKSFIKRLDPGRDYPRFRRFLIDPDLPIRALAGRAAHRFPARKPLLERLWDLLNEESLEVREGAAYSLIALKIPALKFLAGRLSGPMGENSAPPARLFVQLARIAGESGTVHSIPLLDLLLAPGLWQVEKEIRFYLGLKGEFFLGWCRAYRRKFPAANLSRLEPLILGSVP